MRELFELINEYPWTTFFVMFFLVCFANALSTKINK